MENVDTFLEHHGVKGMKWGKHKADDSAGGKSYSRSKDLDTPDRPGDKPGRSGISGGSKGPYQAFHRPDGTSYQKYENGHRIEYGKDGKKAWEGKLSEANPMHDKLKKAGSTAEVEKLLDKHDVMNGDGSLHFRNSVNNGNGTHTFEVTTMKNTHVPDEVHNRLPDKYRHDTKLYTKKGEGRNDEYYTGVHEPGSAPARKSAAETTKVIAANLVKYGATPAMAALGIAAPLAIATGVSVRMLSDPHVREAISSAKDHFADKLDARIPIDK